ncbi:MAG: sigma-70 family RNA polymerase sigma factor [Phycisphaeraceae bacterium]|nr:sigma-70 family RNA polymerase sigma factor [Phycisphaeraceae bacterium]
MTSVTLHRRATNPGRNTHSPHSSLQAVNPPPNPAFDAYIKDRIDFRVLQLTLGFNLSEDDQDDYRAAMVAEVYSAMKRFNPRKAKRETFVNRVLDRYVLYVTRTRCNQMKRPCLNPSRFGSISENFEPTSNDTRQGEMNEARHAELRMDVERVIDEMPKRLQRAARALMRVSPADAARELGLHPSSIYRLMSRIRAYFDLAKLHLVDQPREDLPAAADVEGAPKGVR